MQNFIEEVIPKNLKIENTIKKFFIELEQIVFYFISLFIKTVFLKPNIANWASKFVVVGSGPFKKRHGIIRSVYFIFVVARVIGGRICV